MSASHEGSSLAGRGLAVRGAHQEAPLDVGVAIAEPDDNLRVHRGYQGRVPILISFVTHAPEHEAKFAQLDRALARPPTHALPCLGHFLAGSERVFLRSGLPGTPLAQWADELASAGEHLGIGIATNLCSQLMACVVGSTRGPAEGHGLLRPELCFVDAYGRLVLLAPAEGILLDCQRNRAERLELDLRALATLLELLPVDDERRGDAAQLIDGLINSAMSGPGDAEQRLEALESRLKRAQEHTRKPMEHQGRVRRISGGVRQGLTTDVKPPQAREEPRLDLLDAVSDPRLGSANSGPEPPADGGMDTAGFEAQAHAALNALDLGGISAAPFTPAEGDGPVEGDPTGKISAKAPETQTSEAAQPLDPSAAAPPGAQEQVTVRLGSSSLRMQVAGHAKSPGEVQESGTGELAQPWEKASESQPLPHAYTPPNSAPQRRADQQAGPESPDVTTDRGPKLHSARKPRRAGSTTLWIALNLLLFALIGWIVWQRAGGA